ncbi:MAG: GIY-YIG nuclease family protein [Candidatus Omnitrophota bacterium]
MANLQNLREKFLAAPDSCGVYLMRNRFGQVLYVGKANSLKKRLLNYLAKDVNNKTAALIFQVTDVEFRLTANEAMALLLEAALVHDLKPKYNISLKDDKSFPLVKITDEKFPAVYITRKKDDLSSRYLGPYTNAKLLKSALKIIRHSFGFRSCKKLPKQSCIYARIKLCPAPCIGKITQKEYAMLINQIVLVLEGKTDLLLQKLHKLMQLQSEKLDFEAAAKIRDQIIVLSEISATPNRFTRQAELDDLRNRLNLTNLPKRIEGFDISNISGKQAVGSMVSFENGVADKNNYRRYRIKSFSGVDDYKMLAEVVSRRYSRLIRENKALPDLVLIDGGKGHLLTASLMLKQLNLTIPLVSIAKPRKKTCGFIRGEEKEHIYSSQESVSLNFPENAVGLNLIRRIRDEAHRFALSYHHLLRKKETFTKC